MPIAAKDHTCTICTRPIQIGQKYHRVAELSNGKVSTLKVCLSCVTYAPKARFIDADEQLARAEAAYERSWDR